jgi:hypothetical protein
MASPRWIVLKVCTAAGAALALAVLNAPVWACPGHGYHLTILLGAIPAAAEDSEVLAKVEIIDVQTRQRPGVYPLPVARARVLKSIRGVADGQIVEIEAEDSSCGGGLRRDDVWRQGFIAGRFTQIANETLFTGKWNAARIGSHLSSLYAPDTRPWWRMPWSWFSSPWYLRGALMALLLVLLWRVAGWLAMNGHRSTRPPRPKSANR